MRGQLREEGRPGCTRRRLLVHRPTSHSQAGGQAGSLLEQYRKVFMPCSEAADWILEHPFPGFFMNPDLDQGFFFSKSDLIRPCYGSEPPACRGLFF